MTSPEELEMMTFDNLKKCFESLQYENKIKDDQLCEYKNQLSLVKTRENHYLHEIDVLQCNEKPKVNKLQYRVKQLQEELSQLNQHLTCEIAKQDEELNKLQNELKILSENCDNSSETLHVSTSESFEENVFLEDEIGILSEEVYRKHLIMEQLQELNLKLLESINSLQQELKQVKENVECKKQELVEAYDLMNTLQEDFVATKTELDTLKTKSIKVEDDENSLFAEVNDRRLQLQETLLKLNEKCNQMRQAVSSTQKQIATLRLYNDELTNLLKNDPIECQQDYKTLIDTYNNRILTLENLCEEYEKILLQQQQLLDKGLPNNIVEFLNNIMAEKRKNEEKLNEAVGMEFRVQKMMSLQLKEDKQKVEEWRAITEQLHIKLVNCENIIEELKLQYETSSLNNKQKHQYCESKNHKIVIAQQKNEDSGEYEQKLVKDCNKENSSEQAKAHGTCSKLIEKKVAFAEGTVDSKPSSRHAVRKGGKILQCKSVYFPSLINKK